MLGPFNGKQTPVFSSGVEGQWEVAVVGKNLSDKLTAQHGFQTPVLSGFGYRTLYTDPGRTVSLTGTLRF